MSTVNAIIAALLVTASVVNLGTFVINLVLLRYLVMQVEEGPHRWPFTTPAFVLRWAKNRRFRPIHHEKVDGPTVIVGQGIDPTEAVVVADFKPKHQVRKTPAVTPETAKMTPEELDQLAAEYDLEGTAK